MKSPIKQLISDLYLENIAKEEQWFNDNPGKVMNNYSIRVANLLKLIAIEDLTVGDLVHMKAEAEIKYAGFQGKMNGWGVTAKLYQEIIDKMGEL